MKFCYREYISCQKLFRAILILFLLSIYLFSCSETERNQRNKAKAQKAGFKKSKLENLDRLLKGIPVFDLKKQDLESPTSIFPTLMYNIFNDVVGRKAELPLANSKTTQVPSFKFYTPQSKIEKTYKAIFSKDTSSSQITFDIKFTDSLFKDSTFTSKATYKLVTTQNSKLNKLLVGFYLFDVNKESTEEDPLFSSQFKKELLDYFTQAMVYTKDPQKGGFSYDNVNQIPLDVHKKFFDKFGTHFISKLEIGCLKLENSEDSDTTNNMNFNGNSGPIAKVSYEEEQLRNRKNENNFYVGTIENEQCINPEPIGFEFNPIYEIIDKIDNAFIKKLPFNPNDLEQSKNEFVNWLTILEKNFLTRETNNNKVQIKNVITNMMMLDSGNPNNNSQIKSCLLNSDIMKEKQSQIDSLEPGKWYPIFYRLIETYPSANLREGKIIGWNPFKNSNERFYDLYICIYVDKLINADRVLKDISMFENKESYCINPEKDESKKSNYIYEAVTGGYIETIYYSPCVGYYDLKADKQKGNFWEMSNKIIKEGYIKSLAVAYETCPKPIEINVSLRLANQVYHCLCGEDQPMWYNSLNYWTRLGDWINANKGIYLCYSKGYDRYRFKKYKKLK